MSYIEMSRISKRFASVLANDDVSLSVESGEILALLGENGSGKSTLMNMLSGIYIPDSGTISIDGKPRFFRSPHDAIAARVGMVHQHFKLVPILSAWENISLGEKAGVFINKKRVNRKITDIEERFGLAVKHDKKVYDMSVSERQAVEILKVLYRGARSLVLDEPTAVLTPQEIDALFTMMRNMKEAGNAVIIITHKLNEVLEISDRVTVLRKGRAVGTVKTCETSAKELTEMMVGESVSMEIRKQEAARTEKPLLEVRSLVCRDAEGRRLVDGADFGLFGGEILGVAGIAGSGQKELCEAIAGLRKIDGGEILLNGENIAGLGPRAVRNKGLSMGFVPEDRLGMGLVAGMSVTDNILLRSYDKLPGLFVDRKAGRGKAEEIVKTYSVSTPSVNHPVRKLSGGNIQKVLLGREIGMEPQVLITAYPVRGLDIGASLAIYGILNEQKKRGVAVLFIGEDLDVLRELCDRIMVMHEGRVTGIVDPGTSTKEALGLLMLGHKAEAA